MVYARNHSFFVQLDVFIMMLIVLTWELNSIAISCHIGCPACVTAHSDAQWQWIQKKTLMLFRLSTVALYRGQDESAQAQSGPWDVGPVSRYYSDVPTLWCSLLTAWRLGLLSSMWQTCDAEHQRAWNLTQYWMSSCFQSQWYRHYWVMSDMTLDAESMLVVPKKDIEILDYTLNCIPTRSLVYACFCFKWKE